MKKLIDLMSVTGIQRPTPMRVMSGNSGDCSDQCPAPGDGDGDGGGSGPHE